MDPAALSLGSFLTVLHDSTRAECDEWYADKNRGERKAFPQRPRASGRAKGREDGGEFASGRLGRRCEMPLEQAVGDDAQKERRRRPCDGNQGLDATPQALWGRKIASSCAGMMGSEAVLVTQGYPIFHPLSVQSLDAPASDPRK